MSAPTYLTIESHTFLNSLQLQNSHRKMIFDDFTTIDDIIGTPLSNRCSRISIVVQPDSGNLIARSRLCDGI